MGINHRYLESLPYLTLAILLIILLWLQPSFPYYTLMFIPIALGALFHGLRGGTITAAGAAGGLAVYVMLEPFLDIRNELWRQVWPILLTYFVAGMLIGWLTEREKERERRRIHEIDMEHTRALSAIHDAGREIAASLDLERTLRLVMNKAAETLPMDAGILFTFDERSQLYRVAVCHNLPPEKMAKIQLSFDEGVPGWVVSQRRPLFIEDVRADERVHAAVVAAGVKSVAAYPLITREHVVGVLNLFCLEESNDFDEEARQMGQVYADQAAVFIENAHLVDELLRAAADLEERVEKRTRQLRQTQAQVIRAEKMAVVGRLAGSIAHEVNNPLQAITLHLQLIAEDSLSQASQKELGIVQNELDRIANIVQRLLDFQKPKNGSKNPRNVNNILEEVLTLSRKRVQQANVSIFCRLDDTLSPILVVGDQLKQVFLNLLLNAVEAMPSGGHLEIETKQKNGLILISFTDSGPGISAEVMPHLFEPFVSTKHSGTGLGLAVSQEIVVNHGGVLEAVSPVKEIDENPGAKFVLKLPVILSEEMLPQEE